MVRDASAAPPNVLNQPEELSAPFAFACGHFLLDVNSGFYLGPVIHVPDVSGVIFVRILYTDVLPSKGIEPLPDVHRGQLVRQELGEFGLLRVFADNVDKRVV